MNLFTSEEIYVLASLLGREFIVGVEDRTFEKNRSDLKGMFRRNYSDLESRGVFEYRMDGTLLIDHDVRNAIKVMNKADNAFVVATDVNGKHEKVNYLSYGNQFCKLEDLNSRYSLGMIDSFSYQSILDSYGIVLPSSLIKKISLPLANLIEINDMYNSFNTTEADKRLLDAIQDDEIVGLIRESFLKKSGMFVMKQYKKADCHLVMNNNLILRFVDDYILNFSIDDGETVIVNVCKGKE